MNHLSDLSETKLIRSVCKESFWQFVLEFWDTVPGAGKFVYGWHIELFANELQTIAERVFKGQPAEYDLICNVSPGTTKSTVWSILFHPWFWTGMPEGRFLTASHTSELVLDLSYKSREVIRSEKYQKCFPEVKLCDDRSAVGLYRNTLGGDRLACTVGGRSPMGFHAHILLCDDPIDPKKAVSEAELKTARDFISNVLPTRKVDKQVSVACLIQQRLHTEDPTGVMIENSKKEGARPVRHICLPAELSDNVNPPELREKYVDGLMDPVRLNRTVLREYQATQGAYAFSGQFMQSPVPLGGGMFRVDFFNQRCKAAPYTAKRIRYWDRASTGGAGCRTAGVLMSKDKDGNYFVEHVVVGQWEPDERNRIIRATALRDRTRYGPNNEPAIWVEAEGGSSGRDAWKAVARTLSGFPVYEDRVTGNKEARAEPFACQLSARNVWIVEDNSWDIQDYIDELCAFPMGKYADRVDASSGAFNLLVGVNRSGPVLRILPLKDPSVRKGLMRLVFGSMEELANLVLEQPVLLITIDDPEDIKPPVHGLNNALDILQVSFADIDPKDWQDRWNDSVPPFNKTASELKLSPEIGKRIWSFVLKKREPSPEAIIIRDTGDRRASSLAYAVCDSLRLPRSVIYSLADPDNKCEGEASNKYIYDAIRSARSSVL